MYGLSPDFSFSTISFFSGAAFCGYFADVFGRVPVMMTCIVVTSAFTLAGAFVDDFWAW